MLGLIPILGRNRPTHFNTAQAMPRWQGATMPHHVFSMFPPEVLERDFKPVVSDVLAELGTTMPTLTKAVRAGEFPKLWRICGKLYARRSDLDAHHARIAAMLIASPEDALT